MNLVDLCKERKVQIWVTTHGRLYDPKNAQDRRSLLEGAVDAEYESDKTYERLLRSVRAAAECGSPHGKNLYGYVRGYDPQTRRLLRIEEHPEQAAVVREAARRILAGDSFRARSRLQHTWVGCAAFESHVATQRPRMDGASSQANVDYRRLCRQAGAQGGDRR